MSKPSWEQFFENAVREILKPGTRVLDVAAGLRIDATRGNREDPARAWIKPLVAETQYVVLDPVSTYHPDIVGDVMALPIEDAQYDAVICLAVLEHVQRPWKAIEEIYRVLKPDGFVFVYVPFLSPYHAMPGYYGDYFRFTEDGVRSLFQMFTNIRITPVRGSVETLAHLVPGKQKILRRAARWIDGLRRMSGKQVSGYYVLAHKGRFV